MIKRPVPHPSHRQAPRRSRPAPCWRPRRQASPGGGSLMGLGKCQGQRFRSAHRLFPFYFVFFFLGGAGSGGLRDNIGTQPTLPLPEIFDENSCIRPRREGSLKLLGLESSQRTQRPKLPALNLFSDCSCWRFCLAGCINLQPSISTDFCCLHVESHVSVLLLLARCSICGMNVPNVPNVPRLCLYEDKQRHVPRKRALISTNRTLSAFQVADFGPIAWPLSLLLSKAGTAALQFVKPVQTLLLMQQHLGAIWHRIQGGHDTQAPP